MVHKALSDLLCLLLSLAAFVGGSVFLQPKQSHNAVRPVATVTHHTKTLANRTRAAQPVATPKPEYLSPEKLDALIAMTADDVGVSPKLLRSVLMNESAGNVKAVSKAHAQGLMQLEQGTVDMYGGGSAYEVHKNVTIGANYLASLLHRYDNNTVLAVAAYNAGPLVIDKYGGVPPYPETIAYVRSVLGANAIKNYKPDAQGALIPPTVSQATPERSRRHPRRALRGSLQSV